MYYVAIYMMIHSYRCGWLQTTTFMFFFMSFAILSTWPVPTITVQETVELQTVAMIFLQVETVKSSAAHSFESAWKNLEPLSIISQDMDLTYSILADSTQVLLHLTKESMAYSMHQIHS